MKRLVTRTIKEFNIEAMTVDVSTATVEIKTFTFPAGTIKEDELLKEMKKRFETESIKIVNIENITSKETLYAMEEEKFIESAFILPPR